MSCETKKCPRCGIRKSGESFALRDKRTGRRASECKECHRAIRKTYYANNKSDEIARIRVVKRRNRDWYIKLKSALRCERCGQSHPATLQFHHNDTDAKDAEVSRMVTEGYGRDKILAEIAKCSVLCANCHLILHWDEDKAGVAQG